MTHSPYTGLARARDTVEFLPVVSGSAVLAETIVSDPSGLMVLVCRLADGPYVAVQVRKPQGCPVAITLAVHASSRPQGQYGPYVYTLRLLCGRLAAERFAQGLEAVLNTDGAVSVHELRFGTFELGVCVGHSLHPALQAILTNHPDVTFWERV